MFTRGTMHKLVLKLLCKLKGLTNIIMCKFNRLDLRDTIRDMINVFTNTAALDWFKKLLV